MSSREWPTSSAADIDVHRGSGRSNTSPLCVCGQCHDKSCMTSAIEMSDILTQANAALVETLVKALRLLVDYLGVCAVYS